MIEANHIRIKPFSHIRIRVLLIWFVFGSIFFLSIPDAIQFLMPSFRNNATMGEIVSILFYASVFLFSVELLERNHISLRRLFGAVPSWKNLLFGIGLTIPLFLFSLSTLMFFASFLGLVFPSLQSFFLTGEEDYFQYVHPFASFIGTVLAAPVAEEVLFRGIVLHRCTEKWGFRTAFWVTSLFFGILHAQNALAITFFAFVLGILYMKTRSLYLPIICHMVYNFFSFIQEVGLSGDSGYSSDTLSGKDSLYSLVFVSGIIALFVGLFLCWFIYSKWPRGSIVLPYDRNK